MNIRLNFYLHQHPVMYVFHSKSSCGLQRESPARMSCVGVLKGCRTSPELGNHAKTSSCWSPQTMSQNEPPPLPTQSHSIPQRTWEVSCGLPTTALASRATTYKYLMSGVPFIRKRVNKNILWNWSPMQVFKRLIVWGIQVSFLFLLKCKVNLPQTKQRSLTYFCVSHQQKMSRILL